MAVQSIENNQLPPAPFVRRFASMLDYGTPLDVLDVGCCTGRNAIYFAKLGHHVIGLGPDMLEIETAKSQEVDHISFIAADARNVPLKKQFDVVLMNEVLHQIPKSDSKIVLDSLKKLTKSGGFNAVSDYIGDNPNALESFELYDAYNRGGWDVIDYHEDTNAYVQYGEATELTSLATIIALKR